MPERVPVRMFIGLLLIGGSALTAADEILRDPTRPFTVSEASVVSAPRFRVSAIFVSAERRIAIVNGRRVAIGGHVNGATVVAIENDHLTLEIDGVHITAGLNGRAHK